VRRLFSTFAPGAPGLGLLVLRAATSAALLAHAVISIGGATPIADAATQVVPGATGILLLLGLWTPIAGVLAALVAAWIALSGGDLPFWLLLAVVAVALALLGPGVWSLDARLFGWRRLDIPNGNGHGGHSPPV
jgi:hypothetical protein